MKEVAPTDENERAECPLCAGARLAPFHIETDTGRAYLRCDHCDLIWLEPSLRMRANEERAHYGQHHNDPNDPGYRAFLNRLWAPLKSRLVSPASGLDFGSGPGPTLHLMAQEAGFSCAHYDPFFNKDTALLTQTYDFITCTEVAEHFHSPAKEFVRLGGRLRPGGWLGVMTTRYSDEIDFEKWSYRRDKSHVCFYTDRSFEVIRERFGFESVDFVSPTVVLLEK